MCLAVPMKVVKLNPPMAKVEVAGVSREVNVDLIADVKIDDYVIIHAGYAIEKMQHDEAMETLDLIRQVDAANDSTPEQTPTTPGDTSG